MIILSLIIPFKDEKEVIKERINDFMYHGKDVEVIFVNDGSCDGGEKILLESYPESKMLHLKGVGTGKAFSEGARVSEGKFLMLLPIDCFLTDAVMGKLIHKLKISQEKVFVFPKKYSLHKKMNLYSYLQNRFLLKILKIASWTNVFVLSRELKNCLESSANSDFLVDLELSRSLRAWHWAIHDGFISVSPRRYLKDGAIRRILINGLILFLWYFKLKTNKELKQLYLRS